MSRFIDKLKQLSQAESQPMGFRREKSFSKSRLMLVANAKAGVAAGVLEGADAVLLEGAVEKPSEKTDIPVGIRLGGKAGKPEGIDFVVFKPEMPVTMVEDEKIGKVIAVEATLEMGLLRSLDSLPLDALFIIGDGTQAQVITWQYLMLCRRIAILSSKPVLVAVSPQISKNELQLLWEAGVDGVVVASKTAGSLKKMRSLIDVLTSPSKSKRAKMRAIVTKIGEESSSIEDEEELEEDFED
jgi:hypothetical protein